MKGTAGGSGAENMCLCVDSGKILEGTFCPGCVICSHDKELWSYSNCRTQSGQWSEKGWEGGTLWGEKEAWVFDQSLPKSEEICIQMVLYSTAPVIPFALFFSFLSPFLFLTHTHTLADRCNRVSLKNAWIAFQERVLGKKRPWQDYTAPRKRKKRDKTGPITYLSNKKMKVKAGKWWE